MTSHPVTCSRKMPISPTQIVAIAEAGPTYLVTNWLTVCPSPVSVGTACHLASPLNFISRRIMKPSAAFANCQAVLPASPTRPPLSYRKPMEISTQSV